HGAAAEVAGGVVGGDPGVAAVSESVDGRFLDGFSFVEKSAAVDGHGGPETIVEGGDEAGGVAAPTDPGDGGAPGIDPGEGAQEGVGPDDRGDGVVGPVVVDGAADAVEFLFVALVGASVGEAGAEGALVSVVG